MNQRQPHRKRILIVQFAPDIGGAVTNVLDPLVVGLDRDLYEPIVLFYLPNPYRERFETLGIETILFQKPRSLEHPKPITRLQKNRWVENLQQSNGNDKAAIYHALGSYIRVSYYIPQIFSLAKLMKDNGIDLVHLNSDPSGHGREAIIATKLAGLPCVCYAQNFSEYQSVDRQIARFIDQYVFCSNAIGEHCITFGGAIPAKSRTIYPGAVDVEKWSQPYDTSKLREEFGWSDQDFVLGNIGRLVSWKGQDVFLKAIAEVKREVPDIKALIVGEPDKDEMGPNGEPSLFYQHLLDLTQSLDLTENVKFSGFRSDIPEILAAIDVFVHSSSEPEPFATAVIEAMMAGRPVIATRAGGMPEMIKDKVTGQLATIKDPKAMAEAILFYYRDQDRTKQIALAGQQRATNDLTTQRHIDEFEALYQMLLA